MFDGFMRALLSEYCAECLLSMIEILQFKQRIATEGLKNISHRNDNHLTVMGVQSNQNEEEDSKQFIILPKGCPQSAIVYGEEYNDYKSMARAIYNKYIRIGSEFEVNIDYAARNLYRNLLEDEQSWKGNIIYDDPQKLYYLFNPCIDKMVQLISPSFTRFRQSKQYKLLKEYSPPSTPRNVLKIIK